MIGHLLAPALSYMGYALGMRTTAPSSISSGSRQAELRDLRAWPARSVCRPDWTTDRHSRRQSIPFPGRSFGVGNHGRRPVLEVLNSSHPHAGLVNINPVVGHDILAIDDQADNQEIAIAQAIAARRTSSGAGGSSALIRSRIGMELMKSVP